MSLGAKPRYTLGHEIFNSVSHGIAAGLSIAGLSVLVVLAALRGDPWRIVSFSVYGATLVALYLSSTLYHGIQHPRAKEFFRRLDHSAIYLLIAGTYTPFTLVTMRGLWGWILFGTVWTLATIGILMKAFAMKGSYTISIVLYLAMGWVVIVAIKPAVTMLPLGGLVWMAIGGLFYTFGVVFYLWDRLPFNHGIWHLFVVAGSVCHFFVVMFVVLP